MTNDAFQFYPTPPSLALRVWKKFQNKNFTRVLEPEAGRGDLLSVGPVAVSDYGLGRGTKSVCDCYEIDVSKHEILRALGHRVVGIDFMDATNGASYSHVVMNPPFNADVDHILKAWEILWDGEIAAIMSANNIRNPKGREAEHLAMLVSNFGSVEYATEEFMTDETERKTRVEIAIVYLKKSANGSREILGDVIKDLRGDSCKGSDDLGYKEMHELAIPGSNVENAVLAFRAAVKTMKDAVLAQVKSEHYASLIGMTMDERLSDIPITKKDVSVQRVQTEVYSRYLELKDRAWSDILNCTKVTEKLSRNAKDELQRNFKKISELEFSEANIYGFIKGLCDSQGEIQMSVMEEVFDSFTRYHEENGVFYMGWKSNGKHRLAGMRLRMTRFILPYFKGYGYLDHKDVERLNDIDNCFAMLDGKTRGENTIANVVSRSLRMGTSGERMSSEYFEVRFYKLRGTMHFFPKRKDLVDRLNRIVGTRRAWLPPDLREASKDFVKQYENAEKFDKELREAVASSGRGTYQQNAFRYRDSRDEESSELANKHITQAMEKVLLKHGIDVTGSLTCEMPEMLALAA